MKSFFASQNISVEPVALWQIVDSNKVQIQFKWQAHFGKVTWQLCPARWHGKEDACRGQRDPQQWSKTYYCHQQLSNEPAWTIMHHWQRWRSSSPAWWSKKHLHKRLNKIKFVKNRVGYFFILHHECSLFISRLKWTKKIPDPPFFGPHSIWTPAHPHMQET